MLTQFFGTLNRAVIVAISRSALFHQRIERPNHVVSCDRSTVMPSCLRTQVENYPRPVVRPLETCCNKAIHSERFVGTTGNQGFYRSGTGCVAFGDKGIKAVEGAPGAQSDLPPFGCIRIHVVEVREISAVLHRFGVVHGHRVARIRLTGLG